VGVWRDYPVPGVAAMLDHPHGYKIAELKARLGILREVIADPRTKDALLRLPEDWLRDAERFAEPRLEAVLLMIEQAVKHAETLFELHGPELRIVGALSTRAERASDIN
jgi:hypothetical protein